MATDARDVLSLAMVKAELRINLAETAHDTLKSYEAWRVIVTRQLRLLPLAVIQEGSERWHPDHGQPRASGSWSRCRRVLQMELSEKSGAGSVLRLHVRRCTAAVMLRLCWEQHARDRYVVDCGLGTGATRRSPSAR